MAADGRRMRLISRSRAAGPQMALPGHSAKLQANTAALAANRARPAPKQIQRRNSGHMLGVASVQPRTSPLTNDERMHGVEHSSLDINTTIFCTRFSPCARYVVASMGTGALKILSSPLAADAATNGGQSDLKLMRQMTPPGGDHFPCTDLVFSPRPPNSAGAHSLLTCSATGELHFWDVNFDKMEYEWIDRVTENVGADSGATHSVHFSHTGGRFASGGADKTVRLYDAEVNECVTAWGPASGADDGLDNNAKHCHSNQVFCVRFHPTDDRIVVSGGWDSNVKVWDARQAAPIRSLFGPHISGRGLAINKRNQILSASDCSDNSLQLWDFRSTKKLADIHWNEGGDVKDVVQRRLDAANSGGGSSNVVTSADADNEQQQQTHAQRTRSQQQFADDDDRPNPTPHLSCCAFSPDETMFAAGGTRPAECAVFDARTFEKLSMSTLEPAVHTLDFTDGGKSGNGLQMVIAGADNAVSLYKIE